MEINKIGQAVQLQFSEGEQEFVEDSALLGFGMLDHAHDCRPRFVERINELLEELRANGTLTMRVPEFVEDFAEHMRIKANDLGKTASDPGYSPETRNKTERAAINFNKLH